MPYIVNADTSQAAYLAWNRFCGDLEAIRALDNGDYTVAGLYTAGYDQARRDIALQQEAAANGAGGEEASTARLSDFTAHEIGWLLSLVRMAVKKAKKGVDNFAAKPGQDEGEAAQVREHFTAKYEFALHVHRKLRHARGGK